MQLQPDKVKRVMSVSNNKLSVWVSSTPSSPYFNRLRLVSIRHLWVHIKLWFRLLLYCVLIFFHLIIVQTLWSYRGKASSSIVLCVCWRSYACHKNNSRIWVKELKHQSMWKRSFDSFSLPFKNSIIVVFINMIMVLLKLRSEERLIIHLKLWILTTVFLLLFYLQSKSCN